MTNDLFYYDQPNKPIGFFDGIHPYLVILIKLYIGLFILFLVMVIFFVSRYFFAPSFDYPFFLNVIPNNFYI